MSAIPNRAVGICKATIRSTRVAATPSSPEVCAAPPAALAPSFSDWLLLWDATGGERATFTYCDAGVAATSMVACVGSACTRRPWRNVIVSAIPNRRVQICKETFRKGRGILAPHQRRSDNLGWGAHAPPRAHCGASPQFLPRKQKFAMARARALTRFRCAERFEGDSLLSRYACRLTLIRKFVARL